MPTGKIYKSTNGGSSWGGIKKNLPDEPILMVQHQGKSAINEIYIGTGLGVFHINDDMNEWERFDTNLPSVPVRDLEINIENNTITAATYGRGVWVSPLAKSFALAVDEFENSTFNIYPNPSTNYLEIKNKHHNTIEVIIYDVNGKKIKSYTENTNRINTSFLPSGVYYLKIITDNGTTSKKLIISN